VNCHRQEEGHFARPGAADRLRHPAHDRRYVTVAGARPQRASDAKGWRKMKILVIEEDDEPTDARTGTPPPTNGGATNDSFRTL